MRALTVIPGVPISARLDDIPEPSGSDGAVLVHTLLIGVCGTDRDIVLGTYGSSPPGRQRLVLGHESLGRVLSAPAESGVVVGDLVVGIVRRSDLVPCSACACGEWDMCRNGLYTERGIKHRDGYGAERFRVEPGGRSSDVVCCERNITWNACASAEIPAGGLLHSSARLSAGWRCSPACRRGCEAKIGLSEPASEAPA
jgi:threonine dehydrogenase-like Zn-dependent dehydrogenase